MYARSAHRPGLAKLTSECRWTDSIGPSSRAYRVYSPCVAFTAHHGPAWSPCMGRAAFRGGDGAEFLTVYACTQESLSAESRSSCSRMSCRAPLRTSASSARASTR